MIVIAWSGCSPRSELQETTHKPPDCSPSIHRTYEDLVEILGDENAMPSERRTAAYILRVCEDKAVIPVLISRLNDARPYNLGMNAAGDFVEMKTGSKVGQLCEQLLNAILRPKPRESFPIEDYDAWWKQNRDKSLDEMRAAWRPQ